MFDAGPSEAAAGPLCNTVDITLGTGNKFCDLPGADVPGLHVPPEFCVREFTTTPVKEARVIKFAPNGDLFVAAPSVYTVGGAGDGPGAIAVLPDDDHDGRADAVQFYAGPSASTNEDCQTLEADVTSLACVHGILFANGYLYYTRRDEVRRFPYTVGDRTKPLPAGELVGRLGMNGVPDGRYAHTLEVTKEGSILVSRGRGDVSECSEAQMARGVVFAFHVEEPSLTLPLTPEVIADGFRNPMYLKCAPNDCGDCYASELSGDDWDGVGGREKLALLEKKGQNWGFPCCVTRDVPHPDRQISTCSNVGAEIVAIPLHDTNFGLDFERGSFPSAYRHHVFVALHGVFTSFGGSGVLSIPTDQRSLRPNGTPTMFVSGFGGVFGGRATDVAFAPDGRLFVADDTSGKIYWIAPRDLRQPTP